MLRRLASVALSSALAASVLVGVSAPPAFAAACVEGTDYTVESYSSGGSEYQVFIFTNTGALCSFDLPAGVSGFDYLVVGGGGGGGGGRGGTRGQNGSGGGGGGGGQAKTGTYGSAPSLKILAGAGGTGGANDHYGLDGNESRIENSSGTLLVGAEGGGGGVGFTSSSPRDCAGSGVDTRGWGGRGGSSKDSSGTTVSPGYGYCKPNADYSDSYGEMAAAGGGAGTGGSGLPVLSSDNNTGGWYDSGNTNRGSGVGGVGGDGIYSSIRDGSTSVGYGGGGSGGSAVTSTKPAASSFGGGQGGALTPATDGAANTGGGGGGGGVWNNDSYPVPGGDGADGIVILSIELPKLLTVQTQPPASAASGVALSNSVVVKATDNGVVASGVSVSAGVTGTGCTSVDGTSPLTTDASGLVTFRDLAVNAVDGSSCTLEFTAASYATGTSNAISMSIGPAVGSESVVSVADASLQVALPGNTSAVTVQLEDSGGNALSATEYAAYGPYEVALSVSGAAGSVGAVTNNSDGTYSAVFTGGTQTGTSTVGGTLSLGSGASGTAGSLVPDSVSMTVGAAEALAVATQPAAGSGGYSGQVLGTPPVVNVVDAFGNVVTSDSSTSVTASLVQVLGSGAAFSSGVTNPVTASSGVASFTDLAIDGLATDEFRLDFTASGLSGVSSDDFQIAREPQSVEWVTGSSDPTLTFGDPVFTVSAKALDSSTPTKQETGLPITFASSNEAVCTVSGAENPNASSNTYAATVRITGAGGGGGTCVVTASQAGNDDYAPATSPDLTFTVSLASQGALTITSPSPSSAVFGTDVTLRGTGGDGSGAYSWTKVSGPCDVSDAGDGTGTLSPTGVSALDGPCKVTFAKAGDANYDGPESLTQDVSIAKRDQVVAFTSLVPVAPKSFQTYAARFASSLGASYVPSVAVTTGDGTVCSRVDNGDGTATVSFLAAGTCTLTATQVGDNNTNSGSATQTIVVDSINQNITFNPIADQVFGVPPFSLGASTSSGRQVTYTSSTTGVCTVGASSGVLTIKDKGVCTVTVSRGADAQYAAANSVQRTFVVAAALATAPHISSVSPGDTTITTSFVAPGFTGAPSESIAGYEITATPTSGSAITQPCPASPLVCTMTGLANGTDYRITVAAVNSSGVGASSGASSLLRPATAANAVTGAYAVPGSNGTSVHLYWDQLPNTVATLGGGTFTSYDVYVREVGGSWPGTPEFTTSTDTETDHDFTGLVTGQSYEFKIVAITTANSTALTGNTTIVTEYPSTVPGAVTELTLTETSDTSAVITWEVPITDGGATITSYDVAVPGLRNCSIDPTAPAREANRCVFTGMSLGQTYTFTVTATNRMGQGAASRVSMTTPPPPSADYDGPAVTDQTVPSEVLSGAVSWMVTENGRPVLSSLRPNNAKTGWIITGTGFDTEIIPLTQAKQPVGLGPSDQLEVPQGGWIDVRGDDYRADSLVKAFLVPRPVDGRVSTRSTAGTLYIGSFDANTRGRINGQVYVPLYATAGNWVLQLVGQENTSTLRTTNVALTVIDATPGTETFLTQRAGFFQGKKATLSKKGKSKLRALINNIPEGATLEAITITGVSVSKNTTQANLKLASKRADRIADYLDKRGLSGTIDVTITTQITIGSPRANATTPQPLQTKTGKPLTTTSITYQQTE